MRSLSLRLSSGRWLLATVVAFAELQLASAAWAAQHQKQVLVLYSTRRDAQIVIVGERELPRILDEGLREGVDYYSEYIDEARFPDSLYQAALRDFLRLKYKQHRFEVVIAIDNLALEFVRANRTELFADAPVVFFASSPVTQPVPNSTGVITHLNLSGTLDLATQLQPDVQRVFVVGSAESVYESLTRAQFRPFERRLTITYLTGLATRDLETRLATLPEHSIIYYMSVGRDGAGYHFHPLDYLDRLAAVANAPIYCWVDSAMDHGIVGGSLKDQKAEMDAVATLALRVLRGERAADIQTSSPDLNVTQVDWRQLRRWGIKEGRVPSGTVIRFREPSAWDRYKVYILSAMALLLAQAALIAGLLFQKARRRQAEVQLRASDAKLSTSYRRIRDLGARLLNAQETERSRIARELHDDINQQMAILTIDLELLGGADPAEAGRLAAGALNRAHGVAKSVHDLSHRLHPAKLRLIGLVAALKSLQHEMSHSEIAISFVHGDVPSNLPPDLTLCLFRVVQEGLQNALKYSKAQHVSVHLRRTSDGLALSVVDDGEGFDVSAAWGKGLGLISMSERLEAMDGALEVRSEPGAGTRLEITVPLQVPQSPEPALVSRVATRADSA
jgi:signal transduction histidine kinase